MPKQIFQNTDSYLSLRPENLADTRLVCPECGRNHDNPIRFMKSGDDLLQAFPDLLHILFPQPVRSLTVIHDAVISDLVQEQVAAILRSLHFEVQTVELGKKGLLLESDLPTCEQAWKAIHSGTDLVLGVGSGVISDITKWAATKANLPFGLIGTAPSMNAYTSITATITEGDLKISRMLNPADFVLMDNRLVASAPDELVWAGMGDLAARSVCNADWKLGELMGGSKFCSLPYALTAPYQDIYLSQPAAIAKRSFSAIEGFSNAILVSGLSMTMMNGETSPSSGSEHVISHFWDLLTHLRGLPRNLHGIQVGLGTILMLRFYELLFQYDVKNIDLKKVLNKRLSLAVREEDIRCRFGRAADEMLPVLRRKWMSEEELARFIQKIQEQWPWIRESLSPYLTTVRSIRGPLEKAGISYSLDLVRRSVDEAREALCYGPIYRPRYTVLDLCEYMGILADLAEETIRTADV